MRLFLAIELPDDVRHALAQVAENLRRAWDERWPPASWVRESNLHVTLKFLGEVPDTSVPPLCDALKMAASVAPFRLRPAHATLLPPRGPVRVIGIGLDGDEVSLQQLFSSIESACAGQGFAKERRAYRPHVTIARARAALPPDARRGLTRTMELVLPGPEFLVRSFALIQSQLNPAGSIYAPVAHFPLRV